MKQISEDAAALQDMMQNVNSLLGEQKGTIEKIEVWLFGHMHVKGIIILGFGLLI